MRVIASGCTRNVFPIGPVAIKIPVIKSMRLFLFGLLANIQERDIWRVAKDSGFNGKGRDLFCPVWGSALFGAILFMERVEHVGRHEDRHVIPWGRFIGIGDLRPNNMGWLRGKWVCLDYGSDDCPEAVCLHLE